jgi:aldose 1-epimerase
MIYKIFLSLSWALMVMFLFSCCNTSGNSSNNESAQSVAADIDSAFASTVDGKKTNLYVLKNGIGTIATITNYGGRLVSLSLPDKSGNVIDVVVGFKSVADYINSSEPYFGAIIGRYGNRIAEGKFKLDGKEYTLYTNNGPNTLHGGKTGFQAVVWDADKLNDSTLQLSYLSKDMEEGFPGNLHVKVRYTLTAANELKLDYEAVSDKKTVVNLTNHAFFNLNGEGSGTINNHTLQINADKFTPVDSTLIPTGELVNVTGTPFDFTQPSLIGARVDVEDDQIKNGKGYDHNFVLRGAGMKKAATVIGDKSGITMEVFTKEPGLQFYGGNFMQSRNVFKAGSKDEFRTAFCLETQHFPDSPNQPSFPSTELEPGKKYSTSSIYRFSIK